MNIVPRILIATDSDTVEADVDAALGGAGSEILRLRTGREVRQAVLDHNPDLVILDLQIGSMGGIAACLDLRLEEGADRVPSTAILLLLDRDADVFLARRSGADGWVIKPADPVRLVMASQAVLAGQTYEETARTALG